ncbi:PREDICTED: leucine-rich repeat-containing protein 25 [Condylura cristata]|uniref:leucine-rich repeat-containing protein 25 n=1 Tax=Condylura cristata TaxID=143302 RepID=UPI0003347916|nr:PREDICTED: leucine-rich repeat-containing protein 25 [Condylura cristata]
MGDALALVLLLPLLLQTAGSKEIMSCEVYSGPVNWTSPFPDKCLNFSGKNLTQLPNQSLQARDLEFLYLSGNGLRELLWTSFRQLNKLKLLDVTDNPLEKMEHQLATHCELQLKADCSCALESWYQLRQDNCSDHLECLDRTGYTWHNFSTFPCPHGPSTMTTVALAVSGSLLLVLAIAGPVLAWGLRGRRTSSNPIQGKMWTAQDSPKPGWNQQPRYSNRGFSPKPPAAALPSPSSPDYENMFQGQPTARHRSHTSEDSEVYMNYEGGDRDSQPVYCNLQALGQAPRGQPPPAQTCLDEEYVVPGR